MIQGPRFMDVLGQSSLLVAVLSLAFGCSIFARGVQNRLYTAFFIVCLVICGWSFSFFMATYRGSRDGTAYWFHLLLNVWLAPAGLHFIREFVRVKKGLSEFLFYLSIGLAIALTVMLGIGAWRIPLIRTCIFFAPALVAVQTAWIIWTEYRIYCGAETSTRPTTVGLSPGRRILIYVGALLVLGCSTMDHIEGAGIWFPTFGNVSLAIYLFFTGQAISEQRLLNMRALLSRFLVLIFIALTLTGVYSLLFAWIPNKLGLFYLNSFLVSFLLVSLLDPLRTSMRYLINSLLTREQRQLDATVKDAQRALTGIVAVEPLFERIFDQLDRTLAPERAALFVLRPDQTRFRRVKTAGAFRENSIELLADHPLIQYVVRLNEKGRMPVLLVQQLENEEDRTTSAAEKERLSSLLEGLHALESNLLIPLIESDQVLGFVACSVAAPPESWSGSWALLAVVYPFFKTAAGTLRSMEIFQQQKEKERLAALGEMAAGLAHEIRNPLGAIKGAAQLLDPSANRPESRFLKVIVEEVDRLNHVVTQFLDYSRKESVTLETVDLSGLLGRLVELLTPTLPAGVRVDFGGSRGVRVPGDPVQIHQLFLNLIQNSLQALTAKVSAGGEGRLSVRIFTDDDPAGDVGVTIEDNGFGIKRENLAKIFIPFFTTSPKGTGLGLSICQKIVEAHSGRIEVASEEGKYARFTVFFSKLNRPEPRPQPEAHA